MRWAAACCCFGMIQQWKVDKEYMEGRWVEFGALGLDFVKKVVEVVLVEAIAAGIERTAVAAAEVVLGERDFAFEAFAAHNVAQDAGAGYAAPEVEVEVEVGAECSMCLLDLECIDLVEVQSAAQVGLCGVGFDQEL